MGYGGEECIENTGQLAWRICVEGEEGVIRVRGGDLGAELFQRKVILDRSRETDDFRDIAVAAAGMIQTRGLIVVAPREGTDKVVVRGDDFGGKGVMGEGSVD